MCRFISADTIVPDYINPQCLNRYAYCNNNPLIYVDPTGHQSMDPNGYMGNKFEELISSIFETFSNWFGSDDESEQEGQSSDVANTNENVVDKKQANEITPYIYGETAGIRPGESSGEDLNKARSLIGHVAINREEAGMTPGMHSSSATEKNQWEKCEQAAEMAVTNEAKGIDPTDNAVHFNMREATQTNPQTKDHKGFGPVENSMGPFNNTAGGGDVDKGPVYISTYSGNKR